MKLHYDQSADILYLLDESAITESEEISAGVVLDYDLDEQVVAIEIRDFKRRRPGADPGHVEVHVI
jgi:uncharacterized protein YuzE